MCHLQIIFLKTPKSKGLSFENAFIWEINVSFFWSWIALGRNIWASSLEKYFLFYTAV